MIVDDEVEVCLFLKDFFQEKGLEAAVAYSGIQAIADIPAFKPDLILLDVRMPQMDGLEVLEEIRKMEIHCKIIMMTGGKESGTIEKAVRLGAHYYLTKPFSLQSLSDQVEQFLTA